MTDRARKHVSPALLCLVLGGVVGFLARELTAPSRGEPPDDLAKKQGPRLAPDSAAAYDPNLEKDYPQYQPVGRVLQPCPDLRPGDIPPQDLSVFGGRGKTSFASVDDVANFEGFCRKCSEQKLRVMEDRLK